MVTLIGLLANISQSAHLELFTVTFFVDLAHVHMCLQYVHVCVYVHVMTDAVTLSVITPNHSYTYLLHLRIMGKSICVQYILLYFCMFAPNIFIF